MCRVGSRRDFLFREAKLEGRVAGYDFVGEICLMLHEGGVVVVVVVVVGKLGKTA